MLKNILYIAICSCMLFGCKKDIHLSKIESQRISISDSIENHKDIEAFIKPFREHVNKDLDSVIAYSAKTYDKTEGHLNTAIGNFMADAVFEQANPVFVKRTGKSIDMVVLNYGGIRSIISQGPITSRTAYEVMPFENSIVVVAMKGSKVNEMVQFLVDEQSANPISKLNISVDKDYSLISATISGKPIDTETTYYVATNDYLYNGGGDMVFFKPNEGLTILDYKIRNALIDYFKSIDTLQPFIDNRFIQLNN